MLLYAYYRVLGYPDPPLPPAVVNDRLSSMRTLGLQLREASSALLGRRRDELLHVASKGMNLQLALYEDPQGSLVLFVVHGGIGVTAFEASVCAPHGNVTVSRQDIGSWLVSVASVGDAGPSWWGW